MKMHLMQRFLLFLYPTYRMILLKPSSRGHSQKTTKMAQILATIFHVFFSLSFFLEFDFKREDLSGRIKR